MSKESSTDSTQATHPPCSSNSTSDSNLQDELILSLTSGVGPKIRHSLLDRFGNATNILNAPAHELRAVPGVGTKLVAKIRTARESVDVSKQWELIREHHAKLLTPNDPNYPRLIKELPDPPGIFFTKGTILDQDQLAIGIVGSRHATTYGKRVAEQLASALGRAGFTIISGLARGIDAAAHRGAIKAKARTIGVLGSGLAKIYPPEHHKLAEEVIEHGALISEAPMHAPPTAGCFPQRNRIISGLSLGIIVIEASARSGALITARHAYEQNREVFAVPGMINSRMSTGCHQLIRDGAILVQSADDVIEELGPLTERTVISEKEIIHHPAELMLNEVEKQVLNAINSSPTSVDQVIQTANLPPHRVLSTIGILEVKRLIKRFQGNTFQRL